MDKTELHQYLRQGEMVVANAKINLSIDVLGTDAATGYHTVEMLLQQIPVYDRLFFFTEDRAEYLSFATPVDEEISLACNSRRLPLNEKNLVYKAARLIKDRYHISEKLSVYIEKHIPAGGGLGGGSADGAAVLRGLNQLYALGASTQELEEMAKLLGSDVPFLVQGGAALARGTGTELHSLPPMKNGWLLLVNPNLFLSTERVYKTLDEMEIPSKAHPDTSALIRALKSQDLCFFAENMKNVLELPAFFLCPDLRELKESIRQKGAIGSMMSGSGATVFGLFAEEGPAMDALAYYREQKMFSTLSRL